ncbi:MAG: hypothetical protein ABI832_13265 [bacterium]
MTGLRNFALGLMLVVLAACDTNDLKKPPVPLGDFVMGLNIVLADTAQVPGISRKVTEEEWVTSMKQAMVDRFGRYDGNHIYNFGINIDGYVLAPPGIPVVASPRSALIITVHVFDDATQTELNPGGKQLTMVEGVSPESFIGSGLTQTKKQQMDKMAYRGALAVQRYLLEHPEWFGLPPVAVTEPAK